MKQTSIYIGLNDADEHVQLFKTEKYMSVLRKVCRAYNTAFSVQVVNGGYFHEDGSYVDENSLVLTIAGAEPDQIRQIAEDLCVFFHQESVMITESEADVYFIKGGL